MTDEELRLLAEIRAKCIEDPAFIGHIVNSCVSGVVEQERQIRKQAADMETVAVAMMALLKERRVSEKLKNQMSALALSKLSKYFPDKLFFRWDDSVVSIKEDGE